MEFASALGARLLREGGADDRSRLTLGFTLCVARPPTAAVSPFDDRDEVAEKLRNSHLDMLPVIDIHGRLIGAIRHDALLKTLEEPPAHVKFMFATTDPEKVLPTILSRCQRFDLRRIPAALIVSHLTAIAKQEHLPIGKPLEYDPRKDVQDYLPEARALRDQGPKMYCPGTLGGVRWQPPAYNPNKKLAYSAGYDYCVQGEVKQVVQLPNSVLHDPRSPGALRGQINAKPLEPKGLVTAVNVPINRIVARYWHKYDNESGILATAGGLVFCSGTMDNKIRAFDKDTGAELWSATMPWIGNAPPATYQVDGRQYVVIPATGTRWESQRGDAYVAFALPRGKD